VPQDYKQELITAYELIRGLTEQVADLHMLVVPIVRALEPEHDRRLLRLACSIEKGRLGNALIQSKDDSLALVDHAIRRLRAS
jgi:hypothetical protein